MPDFSSPAEIAREALRRLTAKRIPPTPDQYRAHYHEIAGTPEDEAFPSGQLKAISHALPRTTPATLRAAQQFEAAVDSGNWPTLRRAILALAESAGNDCLRQLSRLLHPAISALLADQPELAAEARLLAQEFDGDVAEHQEALLHRLEQFIHKLEWAGADLHSIRAGLLELLRLILRNISELVLEDRWLHGQLSVLSEAFAGPLDARMLDEVQRRLLDVIDKQSHLKRQLTDAQERLKSMLAGFVDRLANFGAVTGDYASVLARGTERIEAAQDIGELSEVVGELLTETRLAHDVAQRSTEEIAALRGEVDAANQHILRLQRELDEASELVRHDPLTGTLNRKGLDEALEREIALARRRGTQLSIALLDVDNFKTLNDTYGHKTGDEALRHLATVVRESLRPQDSVCRYGGEEFLILLPDTVQADAAAVLVRLQRELTRRIFMADQGRLLITFSAGVSTLDPNEPAHIAIERADRAMYAAKHAGKNRVLVAG
ncbi:GGDEF domain-containing protein [Pseudothauera nasutitermitis]|uniref:diguanylate cyclase n=1 Tax=Pseudothauera nasutitermitis TaxID=2565930 RepID=A0A4S4AZR2_9RHOO|nr:GGDEF domain-containing protein [Pseudothauera nasutitermitis]THF65673.1 GGDEF domain-containing protein [Pseudothauera nasutitermitis]